MQVEIDNLKKASLYTLENFLLFVERAEESGMEQKFQLMSEGIVPTHSETPLPHWFVEYVLSKDFGTQPISLQFEMATINHGKIISNLHILLGAITKDKNINIYSQGTFVHVEISGLNFLPDIFFTDKEHEKKKDKMSILNPLSIFEVLSKSTQKTDRNEKFDQYAQIDSLKEYIIIDQYKPHVTAHRRTGANKWEQEILTSLGSTLTLESINHPIPLAAIYEGVEFEG
ncbi:MAG: Uma2 family endonuclease [Thermoflexibacter sp.]|jgi:Uma2 family endonuclease|nr:Uma2 family endonuclease [Thermoflexibacter sp.]